MRPLVGMTVASVAKVQLSRFGWRHAKPDHRRIVLVEDSRHARRPALFGTTMVPFRIRGSFAQDVFGGVAKNCAEATDGTASSAKTRSHVFIATPSSPGCRPWRARAPKRSP